MSPQATLGSTPSSSTTDDHDTDDDHWPLEVGQHLVHRIKPDTHAYGSADPDVGFRCSRCSTTHRPPADRPISDKQWARNRFDIERCSL